MDDQHFLTAHDAGPYVVFQVRRRDLELYLMYALGILAGLWLAHTTTGGI
jgi:hypothetical protein